MTAAEYADHGAVGRRLQQALSGRARDTERRVKTAASSDSRTDTVAVQTPYAQRVL